MISCIISTYNRPVNILMRAVNSVLNQTYEDIEVIVVNDCPENEQLRNEIRTNLDNLNDLRIKYIEHKKNFGACQARNTGIDNANGEFVAFLDDDDEWLSNKLEKQIKYFTSEDIGMVYCDNYIIDIKNNTKVLHRNTTKIIDSIPKTLLLLNFIGGTSFPLLRTSAVIECGGFDTNLRSSQDVDMWIRISQKYKCIYCPYPLLNYYITDISITNCSDSKLAGYDYIINKYKEYYLQDKKLYNKKLLGIASALLVANRREKAIKYYKDAIKIKPFSINNIIVPTKYILLSVRKKVKGY